MDASLGARGRAFVEDFGATLPGVEIEPTAVYTAEATGVLLDAIARSGGTRAGALDAVMATRLEDGLTGAVRFDANGDVVAPRSPCSACGAARAGRAASPAPCSIASCGAQPRESTIQQLISVESD